VAPCLRLPDVPLARVINEDAKNGIWGYAQNHGTLFSVYILIIALCFYLNRACSSFLSLFCVVIFAVIFRYKKNVNILCGNSAR